MPIVKRLTDVLIFGVMFSGALTISSAEMSIQQVEAASESVPICSRAKLKKLARRAPVVMLGKVVRVNRAFIPCWSGPVLCYENVVYERVETLHGRVKQKQFVVSHLVVQGRPTADPHEATLSYSLFREQHTLLLFLRPATGDETVAVKPDRTTYSVDYVDLDENCGAIEADRATTDFVRTELAKTQNPK